MKKLGMLVCVVVAVGFIAGCSGAKKGKVLVNINGTKVTEGDLEFLGTINPRIQAQIMTPDGKKRILDNLVEQELMYQEAVKEGISRKPDVKAKIDLYRRVIIAQSLVDDEIEKQAKKYYDEHADEFKKLKLSQIMIKYSNPEDAKKAKKGATKEAARSEADALKLTNEIKARLDKGEDFAKVAQETSEDVATKNRGGDIGPVAQGDKRFDARGWGPLVEKAYEMKVGEISGPIKTNQGYHIITVTQGVELEPFEEAKNSIVFKIRNDVKNELLAKLKKDAKIKYPEGETAVAEKPAEGAVEGKAMPSPAPAAEAQKAAAAPAPGSIPVRISPAKVPDVNVPEAKKIAKETPAKAAEKPASAVKKAPAPEKNQ
jgi:parvulin-like peptidyl-prolyl isomerase